MLGYSSVPKVSSPSPHDLILTYMAHTPTFDYIDFVGYINVLNYIGVPDYTDLDVIDIISDRSFGSHTWSGGDFYIEL